MKIKRMRIYGVIFYFVLHCSVAGAAPGHVSRNYAYPGDLKNGYSGYTMTLDRSWHPKSSSSSKFLDTQGNYFNVKCFFNPDHSMIEQEKSFLSSMKTAATRNKALIHRVQVTFTPLHHKKYSGAIVILQIKHIQMPVFYMVNLILLSTNTFIHMDSTFHHAPTSTELAILEQMAWSIHVKQSAAVTFSNPLASNAEMNSRTAQTVLKRVEHSINVAVACQYEALITSGTDKGVTHEFSVDVVEQKPDLQRKVIHVDGAVIGTLVYGPKDVLFYDAKSQKYAQFATPSLTDYSSPINDLLDTLVHHKDVGLQNISIALFTMPVLNIADQLIGYDTQTHYSMVNDTFHGQKAVRISERAMVQGNPVNEDLYLTKAYTLLGFTFWDLVGGKKQLNTEVYFTKLRLLNRPFPLTEFQTSPPAGATAYASK